jgi:sterol desaturase/sphingolipid hydroxylase (fatty acid hydroxylase superfamily)
MTQPAFKIGFWSDKEYFLDRMNLAQLTAAYFQYYAIAAYFAVALVTGIAVVVGLANGEASVAGVAAAVIATIVVYPAVWYVLHRYVLHSKWMWKYPATAKVWKRIHYDHHCDPNNLKVLFGALYTTLPTVVVATMPIGYWLGGPYGAVAALCTGVLTTCFYEFFHCIEHLGYAPSWGWVREMKRTHMAHHFHNENGNYGITNFLWDKILGTFYEGAKDKAKSLTVFNLGYDEDVAKRYPHVSKLTPNWPYNTNPVHRKREAAALAAETRAAAE